MKHMKSSANIRQSFLDFFANKGHTVVASSPLVPGNDPTLLFTNAGMVQFKETFLGAETRLYQTATSVQRCVRAGGKHNDLENVGYTARHHTFFEMLGNFSFGDYFKQDAIRYAWEFLTEICHLPPERLWVTVFDEDDEAADIWLNQVGVSAERFSRIGAKDNFWSMGDTGPCGPCTEIFYDHGAEIPGGPPGSPEEDGDRYIEIWNLVFMQYDRQNDGTLIPLPKPSVDTGMGLERLAAILQQGHSNYDIDLFQSLIKAVIGLVGEVESNNPSLKVIADHIRSCAFLIVDGVIPSNEGRGYVLRRITRRAIRHGHKLGIRGSFFYRLVAPLVQEMGDAYPELTRSQSQVERVLLQEEERFAETLEMGMAHLEEALAELQGSELPGSIAFKLYDTYGFPVDLTADIARERGLCVDMAGFEVAMEGQRQQARAASQFSVGGSNGLDTTIETHFHGYDQLQEQQPVKALFINGDAVEQLHCGTDAVVILAQTPFYAESGGQVGDTGLLIAPAGRFRVSDTRKQGSTFLHIGTVEEGTIRVGELVECCVDVDQRLNTTIHHSATHLLHAALRQVLGEHVQQKGSMVNAERLRFDFAHYSAVTSDELLQIEGMVNRVIRENSSVDTQLMGIDEAKNSGAMALFGEKYGSEVRVVRMGAFSVELCGGTHAHRTGDLGLFKIISESGVAAGVRRIEAVAGQAALEWYNQGELALNQAASLLKGGRDDLVLRVKQLLTSSRDLERQLEQLQAKLASQQGSDLASSAINVAGIQVLAARLDGVEPKALRETVDQLKNRLGRAVIILAVVSDDKIALVAGVTKDEALRLKAGDLLKMVAEQVGGKGGGRPDMAQGGGNQPEHLDAALASVEGWVRLELGL